MPTTTPLAHNGTAIRECSPHSSILRARAGSCSRHSPVPSRSASTSARPGSSARACGVPGRNVINRRSASVGRSNSRRASSLTSSSRPSAPMMSTPSRTACSTASWCSYIRVISVGPSPCVCRRSRRETSIVPTVDAASAPAPEPKSTSARCRAASARGCSTAVGFRLSSAATTPGEFANASAAVTDCCRASRMLYCRANSTRASAPAATSSTTMMTCATNTCPAALPRFSREASHDGEGADGGPVVPLGDDDSREPVGRLPRDDGSAPDQSVSGGWAR